MTVSPSITTWFPLDNSDVPKTSFRSWAESVEGKLTNIFRSGTNTGIGTASPQVPLHIAASSSINLLLANNTSLGFQDSAGNNRRVYLLSSSNVSFIGPVDTGWGGNTFLSSGGDLQFRVNGAGGTFTTAVYIGTNGNVGINTTSPGTRFDILDNTNALARARLTNTNNGTSSRANLTISAGTTSDLLSIECYAAGYSPVGNGDDAADGGRLISSGAGGFAFRASHASGTIRFFTGATERARITSAGAFNLAAGGAYQYNSVNVIRADTVLGSYFFGNTGNLTATGAANIAVGSGVLNNVTTGSNNTAVGRATLINCNTGQYNLAFGDSVLINLTSGGFNTAMGYAALAGITIGSANVGIGTDAGRDVTTASNNTFIGNNSGRGITTGANNVIIGSAAGLASGLSNNVIIADGAGNRRINVDSSGNVGIGTALQSQRLEVVGSGATNFAIQSGASTQAGFQFRDGTTLRWEFIKANNNDFKINRFDSSGAFVDQPLTILGSSGIFDVPNQLGRSAGVTHLRGTSNVIGVAVDGSGNVGVNATDPQVRLDVNGAIRKRQTFTVATLPAASLGDGIETYVSDSNATLAAGHGNVVAGGGANYVPVYSAGGSWRIG
jgi:hypothetical protein